MDERQRMAAEIHDTLAQGLTGIITQIEAAQQAHDDQPERDRHLVNAAQLARQSLTEARRSVAAWRPARLDGAELPQALEAVATEWSGMSGVPVDMDTSGDSLVLLPEVEVALLRAAQEALANVAKHARATRVALSLRYMGDVVTLDVRDDGIGFDPRSDSAPAPGFGLSAMRHRIAQVAGSLVVESEPGEGTSVSVRVPALAAGAASLP
jgi:signal transduction histidine kinase